MFSRIVASVRAFRIFVPLSTCVLVAGCGPSKNDSSSPFFFAEHAFEAEIDIDRDQFRSFIRDARIDDAVKLGEETRRSLFGPVPSSLSFDLDIPDAPRLQFALGVSTFGRQAPSQPVRFRIRAIGGGREAVLFEETIGRRELWIDRDIDIGSWSNQRARLSFETEWASPTVEPEAPVGVLPLWGVPTLISSTAIPERPHIVLISIDCLRADHVGAYGYPLDTTPHLDALAADGVVYEDAFSTSAWTLPSHMSMLTGLLPSQHGVTTLAHRLSDETPFLPDLLKRSGYETTGIVTWWFVSQAYGFDKGFDTFRLRPSADAEVVIDDAIEVLRGGRSHSQFLFLHVLEPHWRYRPEDEMLGRFGPRPADISDLLDMADAGTRPENDDVAAITRLYDAEIATADRAIGRLIHELKQLDAYESALIIVTADHGEAFYEHEGWQHDTLYDEVLRVPLIVKPPHAEGSRVETPASIASILATVAGVSGIEPPIGSAPSLLDLASDEPLISEYEIGAISRRHGRAPPPDTALLVAIRAKGLKYIASLSDPFGDGPPEILLTKSSTISTRIRWSVTTSRKQAQSAWTLLEID